MDSIYLCDCKDRLAMAAVPNQEWCDPYDYATALEEGTIFLSTKRLLVNASRNLAADY